MSDLVERLRDIAHASRLEWPADDVNAMNEAADEIERLRAERDDAVKRMQEGWIEVCDSGILRFKQRAERAEAELAAAQALNAEWGKKAETWLASPEAAKRLEGYRELAMRMEQAEAERDALRKDAERLDWIMEHLFEHRWNGVIDSGSRVHWTIAANWRHITREMVNDASSGASGDFRAAIDAAMAKESSKPAEKVPSQREHGSDAEW